MFSVCHTNSLRHKKNQTNNSGVCLMHHTSKNDQRNGIRMQRDTHTHTHTYTHRGPIVYLTSSLVYCSSSRLIPDFCLCSSSSSSSSPLLCIKCPHNSFNKGDIQRRSGGDPLFQQQESVRAHMPHIQRTRTHTQSAQTRILELKSGGKKNRLEIQTRLFGVQPL